jgi:hypothetical protein
MQPSESQAIPNAPTVAGPVLEYVAHARIVVDVPRVVGRAGKLERRVVTILGGHVEGPNLKATVLPGGADWQTDDGDGVLVLEAKYLLETHDGTTIGVVNRGLRHATPAVMARLAAREAVAPDEYYFRTTPTFDAPPGPYAWLRQSIFVATSRRDPDAVTLDIFRIR